METDLTGQTFGRLVWRGMFTILIVLSATLGAMAQEKTYHVEGHDKIIQITDASGKVLASQERDVASLTLDQLRRIALTGVTYVIGGPDAFMIERDALKDGAYEATVIELVGQ